MIRQILHFNKLFQIFIAQLSFLFNINLNVTMHTSCCRMFDLSSLFKHYITTIRKLPVVIMSALKFSVNLSDSFNMATFVFLTQIQVLEKYRECVNENICQSLCLVDPWTGYKKSIKNCPYKDSASISETLTFVC